MRIRSHSESHIVELDDGSRWQIFPGDLDLTLGWKPETELSIVPTDDEISSHALIGGGEKVRVTPAGQSWPIREVNPFSRTESRDLRGSGAVPIPAGPLKIAK
jgi:hypothetical protein